MSTYAIKADKFFLPAGPQLGGYLMVEDGVFGALAGPTSPLARLRTTRDRGSRRAWSIPTSMASITTRLHR